MIERYLEMAIMLEGGGRSIELTEDQERAILLNFGQLDSLAASLQVA